MNLRVRTLAIEPCGCGFEGSIRFQLEDIGEEISCSYISMNDEEVSEEYVVGAVTDAPVILAFGTMKRTTKRTLSLLPALVGQFVGWETIDDVTYGVVAGPTRIPVDIESGEFIHGLSAGDWVECTGELSLGHILEDSRQAVPSNR